MWVSEEGLTALWLSIRLSTLVALLLLLLAIPLAWWLARTSSSVKNLLLTLVSLPLVLPPTVLGFYLLLVMSPAGWLGGLAQVLGLGVLPFSFLGLVVASMVYSLPFVVQPLYNVFHTLPNSLLEAAASLGVGAWRRMIGIIWPLTRRGIVSAGILGFAHTLGEFGIVLMIGGNIPGETRVVSVLLYEHVEALDYDQAHRLAAVMMGMAFVVIFVLNRLMDSPSAWIAKLRN